MIKVYFQPQPHGDFSILRRSGRPLVAVLRQGAGLATRVDDVATSIDSAHFVSGHDFKFGGRRINLRRLLRNGVTFFLTGSAVPVATNGPGAAQFAFSGTAIAIGESERSDASGRVVPAVGRRY